VGQQAGRDPGVGNQAAPGSNPVYDALIAANPGGVYYPSQTRQLVKFNRGTTLSAATGFEWRINDEWKFGANAFVTKRKLDEAHQQPALYRRGSRQRHQHRPDGHLGRRQDHRHRHALHRPDAERPRAYINKFSAENINTFDSVRSEPAQNQTWAINPTLEFKNDAWKATANLTVSRPRPRPTRSSSTSSRTPTATSVRPA
jgi:hypothetical protein